MPYVFNALFIHFLLGSPKTASILAHPVSCCLFAQRSFFTSTMWVGTNSITLARTKLGASIARARKCRSDSTQRPNIPPCTLGCKTLPKTFSCPLTVTAYTCRLVASSRFSCFTACKCSRRTVYHFFVLHVLTHHTFWLFFRLIRCNVRSRTKL